MKRLITLFIAFSILILFFALPATSSAASITRTSSQSSATSHPHIPTGCQHWQEFAHGQEFGTQNDNIYIHLFGAIDAQTGRHCFYAHVDNWTGASTHDTLIIEVYTGDDVYSTKSTISTNNASTWYHVDTSEIDEIPYNCMEAHAEDHNGNYYLTIYGCR